MIYKTNEPIEMSATLGDLATIADLIIKPHVYMSPSSKNVKDMMPYVSLYLTERAWFRRSYAVLGRARRWL